MAIGKASLSVSFAKSASISPFTYLKNLAHQAHVQDITSSNPRCAAVHTAGAETQDVCTINTFLNAYVHLQSHRKAVPQLTAGPRTAAPLESLAKAARSAGSGMSKVQVSPACGRTLGRTGPRTFTLAPKKHRKGNKNAA